MILRRSSNQRCRTEYRIFQNKLIFAEIAVICSLCWFTPVICFSMTRFHDLRPVRQSRFCSQPWMRQSRSSQVYLNMCISAESEPRLLGSRRLHNAFKGDAKAGMSTGQKQSLAETSTKLGDWGRILPLADRPRKPPLPRLSEAELRSVSAGERLQKQTRTGRTGHGLVVFDVKADPALVYAILSDIESYPLRVPTVREACVQYNSRNDKVCKSQFKLSRFRLEINAELRCVRDRNMIEFRLDPDRENPVLEQARGYWFVEDVAAAGAHSAHSSAGVHGAGGAHAGGGPYGGRGVSGGGGGGKVCRVWLVADVTCNALLPTFLIDYAASRALPRATTWLAPALMAMPGGADDVSAVLSPPAVLRRHPEEEEGDAVAAAALPKPAMPSFVVLP